MAKYNAADWDSPATAPAPTVSNGATTDPDKLFDITCIVGSVYKSDSSGLTPNEAAFLLIARHGADGEYQFPAEHGGTINVGVFTNPTPQV